MRNSLFLGLGAKALGLWPGCWPMLGPEMTEACGGAAGWVLKGHLWQECTRAQGGDAGGGEGL